MWTTHATIASPSSKQPLHIMQPNDLILKRQTRAGRPEYVLYQYDGSPTLKQVDGPWSDEAEAKRTAVERWASEGDVYYETAPNLLRVISGS